MLQFPGECMNKSLRFPDKRLLFSGFIEDASLSRRCRVSFTNNVDFWAGNLFKSAQKEHSFNPSLWPAKQPLKSLKAGNLNPTHKTARQRTRQGTENRFCANPSGFAQYQRSVILSGGVVQLWAIDPHLNQQKGGVSSTRTPLPSKQSPRAALDKLQGFTSLTQ